MKASPGYTPFAIGYEGRIGNSKGIYKIIEINIKLLGRVQRFKKAILVS